MAAFEPGTRLDGNDVCDACGKVVEVDCVHKQWVVAETRHVFVRLRRLLRRVVASRPVFLNRSNRREKQKLEQ